MASDSTRIETPVQDVNLTRAPTGRIVDIGGGGEGIVSRLAEERVCVVDVSVDKIREARIYGAAAEWFAADGKALPFQDKTFDTATLWFSLAYISDQNEKKLVLREVFRVLRSSGTASILGMVIEDECEAMTFNGRFIYPDGYVSKMSYRVRGNQQQNHLIIEKILKKSGFSVVSAIDNGYWFELAALKR